MTNQEPGQPNQLGPYRIISTLGRGGMGIVYHAEHIETGKKVALKTVIVRNLSQISSIRREIRALARINHPGVVRITDEGLEGEIPWYAMEYLEGVTLRRYCAEFVWGGSEISTAGESKERDESSWNYEEKNKVSSGLWTKIFGTTMDEVEIQDSDAQIKSDVVHPVPKNNSEHQIAAGGFLQSVLTLTNHLCQTLAYLHGEGMVHGDLKPDNIMIRRDGIPVIMDFGLVTQIWKDESREKLTVHGISGGTVMYIAPEKILGELVDARADLYSLGCMLYELVTGQTPFSGQSAGQIIKAQLECDPISPSELVEGVPQKLDRLILQLLTKKPKNRISHSDDVSRVLTYLGAETDTFDDSFKPRTYLFRPRFAGREKEILIMEKQFDQLDSGRGSLTLVGGESGIGKTRFLLRMIREARQRKFNILTGECIQIGSPRTASEKKMYLPLQALRQPLRMIAECCLSKGQVEIDRIVGSRGKVLSMYEPYISELPGQEAYPAPAVLPANAARLRLYTCLLETFQALAVKRPYLLVLDDLQWGDDLTLGFLEFILRTGYLKKVRFMIAGTYRAEEVNSTLQRLINSPSSCCIELSRLDEGAVSTIVTDMLGMLESPQVFVPFLTRFSEGNPFFVAEYLRTALEIGILYRDDQGKWQVAEESSQTATDLDFESLPLPRALAGLLERRLKCLSDSASEVVAIASVFGHVIPVMLLWSILPFNDETIDAIDELLKKQVLSEESAGDLCFIHDKIRKIVYEGIPRDQRAKLHFSSAQAIESIYGEDSEEHSMVLAQHWELAGDRAKAQKYYLSSARQAASRYALLDAETAYSAYLNLVDQPTSQSIEIRLEYAQNMLSRQGRFKEAQNEYLISIEDARNLNEKLLEGKCLLCLARTNEIIGTLNEASELCKKSLEIFIETENMEYKAAALSCLGSICFDRGALDEAKTLYHESIEIHGKLDCHSLKGTNLEHLALVYWKEGDMERAQILFEQAMEIFHNIQNKHALGRCLGNFANVYAHQGDFHKARELYEQSIAISREIGDKHNESIFLGNLGSIHCYLGNLDIAQKFFETALKVHRDIGDRRMEGITLGNLGTIYKDNGQAKKAYKLYQSALSIHQELIDQQHEAITLCNLGEMKRIVDGDFDVSEKMLESALAISNTIGDRFFVGICLSQLGHIAIARGFSSCKYLKQIQSIIDKVKPNPDSNLSKDYQELKYTEEIFKIGGRLFRGERIENIPDGLQKWLTQNEGLETE